VPRAGGRVPPAAAPTPEAPSRHGRAAHPTHHSRPKVFDGHCGPSAAQFVAARALERVIYSRHFPHHIAAAMVGAWARGAPAGRAPAGVAGSALWTHMQPLRPTEAHPPRLRSRALLPTLYTNQHPLPHPKTDAFLSIELEYHSVVVRGHAPAAGTTALAALVWGGRVVLANAGDSRAVLCRWAGGRRRQGGQGAGRAPPSALTRSSILCCCRRRH
jgi:hypothetical protein